MFNAKFKLKEERQYGKYNENYIFKKKSLIRKIGYIIFANHRHSCLILHILLFILQ